MSGIIADAITSEPDMEMAGLLPTRGDLRARVETESADIVIMGLEDLELPSECLELFDAHPFIRVLGVSTDGRHAALYELRPQRLALGEASPDGLIHAIRDARARI